MREDVGIALHQQGVVAERVELLLRKSGVVIFDERDRLVLVDRDQRGLITVLEVQGRQRAVIAVVDQIAQQVIAGIVEGRAGDQLTPFASRRLRSSLAADW